MRRSAVALVMGLSLVASAPAEAGGTIERACLKGGRAAANRTLCACIQKVADATLSQTDQRRGAAFFDDPHKSQEIRASDSRANEAFWQRWLIFAESARQYCG